MKPSLIAQSSLKSLSYRLSENFMHLLLELLVVSEVDESISKANEDGWDDEVILRRSCSLQGEGVTGGRKQGLGGVDRPAAFLAFRGEIYYRV
jgi:hypothetical protein